MRKENDSPSLKSIDTVQGGPRKYATIKSHHYIMRVNFSSISSI